MAGEWAAAYEGRTPRRPVPSTDLVAAVENGVDVEGRARELRDAPSMVELPSDLVRPAVFDHRGVRLPFSLSAAARAACTSLATGVTPSVLRADEAAALTRELDQALVELAAGVTTSLAEVRAVPEDRTHLLAEYGTGTPVDADAGLWQLLEEVCARRPHVVAVRDRDGALTYEQLRHAVEAQSAALRLAGVGEGDHVVLALDRAVREVVAVLATLRLGAAYVGLASGTPAAVAGQLLRIARPRAVLVPVLDPWADTPGDPGPAAPPDPSRIAYVSFTSGSTGEPKGVRIPHRGVVRLAHNAELLVDGATDRFLRLAPLAFDASTLEIFAPLLAGGTVEVYPERHVVPSQLAAFLRDRAITGLWLTAGLFRLVADDQPAAFRAVRQVLTGGDVVPPAQVRQVLRHCPGLRVTNGYGPTENTTFTAVHHVDDPAEVDDPLPIGRPVPGTRVEVLDEHGRALAPGRSASCARPAPAWPPTTWPRRRRRRGPSPPPADSGTTAPVTWSAGTPTAGCATSGAGTTR